MSLWTTRDEPVLRHLAEHPPQDNAVWTHSRRDEPRPELPEVTEREFHRSMLVLGDAGYVACEDGRYDGGGGCVFTHFQVTGAGMQALGLWPMSTSSARRRSWQRSSTLLRMTPPPRKSGRISNERPPRSVARRQTSSGPH